MGERNAYKIRAAGMGRVAPGKTVRIVRKIVRAVAAIICARWVRRAAIVPVIAARVVAMVNATMAKPVRVA